MNLGSDSATAAVSIGGGAQEADIEFGDSGDGPFDPKKGAPCFMFLKLSQISFVLVL